MSKHTALKFTPLAIVLILLLLVLNVSCKTSKSSANKATHWVGTWYTATQLVERNNMPPAPGLQGNTLRQVVRVSIGGAFIRVKVSNAFSKDPVSFKSIHVAVSNGGSAIDAKTNKKLTFNGSTSITLEPGSTLWSDPIPFHVENRMDVALTICYDQQSQTITGHPGSRTTSYIIEGNNPENNDFTKAVKTEHWYNINAIDVMAPTATRAVAILGNSITDGRGSTTDAQNRWPDVFSERLLRNNSTDNVAVLNAGIGGNCVLRGGLGPTGNDRFEKDILEQSGIKWAIIYIGVNDLGGVRSAESSRSVQNALIESYKKMVDLAHEKKILIYGATIMPFKGNGYYNVNSEAARVFVNEWIRKSNYFDGVIDLEKSLQNPQDTSAMLSTLIYQNDYLHPNAEGHKRMGDFIDLNLFINKLN